jgi:hypothetical protein
MDVNDWVCGNCKSVNRRSANSCYSCGGVREIVAVDEARPLGLQTMAAADGQPGAAAPMLPGVGGAGALVGSDPLAVPGDPQSSRAANTNDLLGGLLGGLVAAVFATGLWYAVVAVSQYQLGIIAIVVGFLVGQGVVLGAGRHPSVALVGISVVLTLLALVISEYLIVAKFVGDQLAPGQSLELMQPPTIVLDVVAASVQEQPLTLAFWAIALFQAFTIPARLSRTATA